MKRPALKTALLALALTSLGLGLAGCVYYPGYGPGFYAPGYYHHGGDYHHDDD